jgi:hypothetical protein
MSMEPRSPKRVRRFDLDVPAEARENRRNGAQQLGMFLVEQTIEIGSAPCG